MRKDFVEVLRFDWEYGVPLWVNAYIWGYLLAILGWLTFGVAGTIKYVGVIRKKLAC